METFSTSKVLVEYHDPSNLFPLIAPKLNRLFPLRNLNWSSPSRPLRSIDSLHVELVPALNKVVGPTASVADQRPTSSDSTGMESTTTTDNVASTVSTTKQQPEKQPQQQQQQQQSFQRRHQIPGLRKTPYLKLYLLRCDDKDTYKTTTKKALKEWVNACTNKEDPSSATAASAAAGEAAAGSGKSKAKAKKRSSRGHNQEDHDAFEWMILHVVFPGTQAAGQERPGTGSGTGSKDDKQGSSGGVGGGGSSKWPGRSSRTLLEKLRSDFNVSGKSAPDRIAQIKLEKGAIPSHMMPSAFDTGEISSSSNAESTILAEQERALSDVAAKFKILILQSFGLRVSQYEDDIQERESQRSLPGWNFCTFFMLKEGLARGFESVGLVEDALVIYDELLLGLNAVIEEHALSMSSATGTSGIGFGGAIRSNTRYLQSELALLSKEFQNSSPSHLVPQIGSAMLFKEIGSNPLSPKGLNYRDLILSNKISIFEFKCYIFTRQMSLLLRLAKVQTASVDALSSPDVATHASSLRGPASNAINASLSPSRRQVKEDVEDPVTLADVCQRTLRFISSVSRTLKEDMLSGTDAQPQPETPNSALSAIIVQNVVLSWSYAIARLVLERTATLFLADMETSLGSGNDLNYRIIEGGRSSSLDPSHNINKRATMTSVENVDPKVQPEEGITRLQNRPHSSSSQHLQPHPHLPPRSSSFQNILPTSSFSGEAPYSLTPRSSQVVYEQSQRPNSSRSVSGQLQFTPRQNVPASALAGIKVLAASRADLYLLQRRVLDHLARLSHWDLSWSNSNSTSQGPRWQIGRSTMKDVDLSNGSEDDSASDGESIAEGYDKGRDFDSHILAAMPSIYAARQLYEFLSERAMRYYVFSGRTRSGENMKGDLAVLKFKSGDYTAAATFLKDIAPQYAKNHWGFLESSLLEIYAQCLKKLDRIDEYIQILLLILAKSVSNAKRRITEPSMTTGSLSLDEPKWLDAKRPSVSHSSISSVATAMGVANAAAAGSIDSYGDGLLEEAITCSEGLSAAIQVPFVKYFGDLTVDNVVYHTLNRDGFRLQLRFRHMLDDELVFDKVSMHVRGKSSGNSSSSDDFGTSAWSDTPGHGHLQEFSFENVNEDERIEKGENMIWLEANINTIGTYHVEKIIFKAKNITFVHDHNLDIAKMAALPLGTSDNSSSLLSSSSTEPTTKKPRILCYPPKDALHCDISYATYTKVNERRRLEIKWTSGWNAIHGCELRLRSASAGLRLFTAEATRVSGDMDISDAPQTGVIRLSPLQQQQQQQKKKKSKDLSAQLSIPYDLENASLASTIAIGMEMTYQTDEGEFKLLLDAVLSTELPLSVNVHDIFKEAMLFSRFQIQASSANRLPVQVTGLELDASGTGHVVKAPSRMSLPIDVLPGQPLWAIYMITQEGDGSGSRDQPATSNAVAAPLSLILRYRHFTAIVMRRVESLFSRDLLHSRFGRFKWLLLPRLLGRVRKDLHHNTGDDGLIVRGFSAIAMTNEVCLGLHERFGWPEVYQYVEMKDREVLDSWLREWHKKNSVILLRPPDETAAADQPAECQLIIDVPVPSLQVLHTVSLTTIAENGSRGTTNMLALGDVLTMELEIKHTRHWDTSHHHGYNCPTSSRSSIPNVDKQKDVGKKGKAVNDTRSKKNEKRRKSTEVPSKNNTSTGVEVAAATTTTAAAAASATGESNTSASQPESDPDAVEFIYDIRADPNVWLVAGQRRTRFTVGSAQGSGGVHRFRVFLIPLVTGELLFPGVDIKLFEKPTVFEHGVGGDCDGDDASKADDAEKVGKDTSKSGRKSGSGGGGGDHGIEKKAAVTFETDYLSQSESIVVVPNLRSCTVGVEFSGDDGKGKGDGGDVDADGDADKMDGEGGAERLGTRRRLVQTRLLDVEYRTEGFG